MFFRKVKQKDRVADLVNKLGPQGDMQAIERGLAKLAKRRLSEEERASWHAMRIAVAMRLDDRDEAFVRAVQASKELPDNSEIAFSLGQEYEHRGMTEKMVELFRQVPAQSVSTRHSLMMTRYCCLHSRHDDALAHIYPVIDAHFELGVADDNFLYMRGMPFAAITFATAGCLLVLLNRLDEADELIHRAVNKLTDHNLEYLVDVMSWYMSSSNAIPVAPPKELTYLHGVSIASHLAWRLRTEPDIPSAMSLLDQAQIPEGSHGWLDDVLVLSRAELMHRLGDSDQEAQAVQEFLKRQPLMFEPHWVFEFGFVEYQERLKSVFWRV